MAGVSFYPLDGAVWLENGALKKKIPTTPDARKKKSTMFADLCNVFSSKRLLIKCKIIFPEMMYILKNFKYYRFKYLAA